MMRAFPKREETHVPVIPGTTESGTCPPNTNLSAVLVDRNLPFPFLIQARTSNHTASFTNTREISECSRKVSNSVTSRIQSKM